jgi:hypothetical protein
LTASFACCRRKEKNPIEALVRASVAGNWGRHYLRAGSGQPGGVFVQLNHAEEAT